MNIRYGKHFKILRKVAKYLLVLCYPIVKYFLGKPKVASIDETLDILIHNRCSICRFGDGDFQTMIEKLDLPYQKYDPKLGIRMLEVIKSERSDILVGLHTSYRSTNNLIFDSRTVAKSQYVLHYWKLKKYLKPNKQYYNACISRFYYEYIDKTNCSRWITKLKMLWKGRSIVIIEGEKSRLGVGNDLFAEATSIKRILGPKHDAFDRYEDLLSIALRQNKTDLILIALGSTATVLAYDLALQGYQALDIGNIDIEYEWYRMGATEKVKVKGKYTSEVSGGRVVEDINDHDYESQIIAKFL